MNLILLKKIISIALLIMLIPFTIIAQSNLKTHPIIAMWHTSLLESLQNEINSKNRKIMNWVYKHEFKYVDFNFKKR